MFAPLTHRLTRILSTTAIPIAFLTIALCATASAAKVVYVNANAAGTVHDGASWSTAFTDILPAIDAASEGDEVWVAGGTYATGETVPFLKDISLYGGFAGTESATGQRDWQSNKTVLRSSINCISAKVTLDGLIGCAVDVKGYGSVSIINCDLRPNWVEAYFGDIQIVNSRIGDISSITGATGELTVIDSTVDGNCCDNGSNVVLINSTFKQGVAACDGTLSVSRCVGTYFSTGANCWWNIEDSVITNFSICSLGMGVISDCLVLGGGVEMTWHDRGPEGFGRARISGCTLIGNGSGTGISAGGNNALIGNCIVVGYAVGIQQLPTDPPARYFDVKNCDSFGNGVNYQDMGDLAESNGNISRDPLFVDSANGDYHLNPSSPCITPSNYIGAYGTDSPLVMMDVVDALKIKGGFSPSSPESMLRLDLEPVSPGIDLADSVRIARRVAGLEINPGCTSHSRPVRLT